jgi:hypothetical protein
MIISGIVASSTTNHNLPVLGSNGYVPPTPTYAAPSVPPVVTIPPVSNVTSSSLLGFSSASWDASPIPGALYNVTITNSDGSVTSYTTGTTNAFAVVATPGGTVNYQVSVVAPVNGVTSYSPITNVSVGSYNYGSSFLGGF